MTHGAYVLVVVEHGISVSSNDRVPQIVSNSKSCTVAFPKSQKFRNVGAQLVTFTYSSSGRTHIVH
jgi:hypothetical protein